MKKTSVKVVGNRIINIAEASMKTEGFHVSSHTKSDCIDLLNGKTSANALVKKYTRKYVQ